MNNISIISTDYGLSNFALPDTYVRVTRNWLKRRFPAFVPLLDSEFGMPLAKAFLIDALWACGIDIRTVRHGTLEENEKIVEAHIWSGLSRAYDNPTIRRFFIKKLETIRSIIRI